MNLIAFLKSSFLLVIIMLITSCAGISTENISRITYHPVFKFEKVTTIPVGEPFVPAATAKEGDTDITDKIVVSSATVDTSEQAVLDVTYQATNKDGVKVSSKTQKVIVYEPQSPGAIDLSGNIYDTNRNERTGVITRIENSDVYHCTDCAFGGTFPLYLQVKNKTEVSALKQTFVFSSVTEAEVKFDQVKKELSVTIIPQGFSYTFAYK